MIDGNNRQPRLPGCPNDVCICAEEAANEALLSELPRMTILGFLPEGYFIVEMVEIDPMVVIKTTEIRLGDEGIEITRSIEVLISGPFGFSGDPMDAFDLDLSEHIGDDMPARPTTREGVFRFGAGGYGTDPVREMFDGKTHAWPTGSRHDLRSLSDFLAGEPA